MGTDKSAHCGVSYSNRLIDHHLVAPALLGLDRPQPTLALQAQTEHGTEHGKARSREASQCP